MKTRMIIQSLLRLATLLFTLVLGAGNCLAAQQYQGLCSYVKIEILQELSLERIGFLATLTVTNNEGDASITAFSSALTFARQGAGGAMEDASSLFFVQPPKIQGVTSIDGAGIISPGQTAVVEWFIIPKIGTGGTSPDGLEYQIGASLAGSIYGMEISPDVFAVLPDTIMVKPDPELEITYFQPRDVDGDNPFTPNIVESPIPFTLGVLVKNVGYGQARKVKIASEQPRIVENVQGLLVVPRLLGARVDDQPTDSTTLTVDLGDIAPGKCRKGAWDMITSLSGEFTEFRASYTHSSDLGGTETSLIRDINAYFIVHEVLNDQPGRDSLLDFLAETQGGEQLIPDTLFESDCNTLPVNRLQDVSVVSFIGNTATIHANADFANWVFMRLDDPGQAKYPIERVVRSDGKVLSPHNYWTTVRYRYPDNVKLTYLNIFDFVALGQYQYTVTYKPPDSDAEAPVTTINFSGPFQEKAGQYYVLPTTQIFFLAQDASPVGTYYKLDGAADFVPAYSFEIPTEGLHTIEYYSQDMAGNAETHQVAEVMVSVADPGITDVVRDGETFRVDDDSLSIRPTAVTVGFKGVMTAARLDAVGEVYRGILAYPMVSGVLSSPTRKTGATITVGGENVDFYRYRLGTGAWSAETPVATPITLSGLSGTVTLAVSGRNQHGAYHPDSDAVQVSWTVDPAAPVLEITGTPATVSRSSQASLNVVGSTYYCYRLDGTYYRPDTGAGLPITLANLADGEHTVEVKSRATSGEACPGNVPGTMARWTVDRLYGQRFPDASRVRSQALGQVDASPASFTWDGRADSGVAVPPGWYSLKITLQDGLGRETAAVSLVYVGNMVTETTALAGGGSGGQKEAHAWGRWAVWQDQRQGNWDIFAQELGVSGAVPVAVTTNTLNQERPRTDGTYVIWEDRQADGTWDIWIKKLGSADPAVAVTTTPDMEERKPFVYWPWVVYQTKPNANPNAPWQIAAHNMLTATTEIIDATTQNQLDPVIHRQRVVWQDFRDTGYGEIYFKDLATGEKRRITNNPGGQYYPVIYDQWIVWADNRNTQFDLYGYNLKRNVEVQLTNTPEDETRPTLNDRWVVYEEDAAGENKVNVRLLHLANMATIQLTNEESLKEKPSLATGRIIWTDQAGTGQQIMAGTLPDLQPVFGNLNPVAITAGMAASQGDAFTLLRLWHGQAGVTAITRYATLLPQPVADTVSWGSGAPTGTNFTLTAGSVLWTRFNNANILDLGQGGCEPLNLTTGINVLSYTCFPDGYSAWDLIRALGVNKVKALRVLDSETGLWQVAMVADGRLTGDDFKIATVSVLMLDMQSPVGPWRPGETP